MRLLHRPKGVSPPALFWYVVLVTQPSQVPPRVRPTVILPDTSPLVHLAAADALHILTGLGRVVVVDVVALEATNDNSKPYAAQIAAWIAEGGKPGSNRPVEVAATELGTLYKLALDQNMKPPRNAGEIGITEWLADELRHIGGPALVVYENGRIPNMWRGKASRKRLPSPRPATCLNWRSARA